MTAMFPLSICLRAATALLFLLPALASAAAREHAHGHRRFHHRAATSEPPDTLARRFDNARFTWYDDGRCVSLLNPAGGLLLTRVWMSRGACGSTNGPNDFVRQRLRLLAHLPLNRCSSDRGHFQPTVGRRGTLRTTHHDHRERQNHDRRGHGRGMVPAAETCRASNWSLL
jgi:hypothetical protein